MKFTRDQVKANTVRKVERGAVIVGEHTYTGNIGLLPQSIIEDWPLLELAELSAEALQPVLDLAPEMLLIGTGWKAEIPPRELVFALARKGIGLECMDTPAACRTFNILVSEDREPAAILYI